MKALKLIALQLLCVSFFIYADMATAKSTTFSDEQIKQKIIEESIASYPGNCPCPYNSARNGSRCGGRSAWSKAGGYAPLCFKDDVTNSMVAEWKKNHRP